MTSFLLQNYFTKILEDNLKAIIKPQYVDHIPKVGVAISICDSVLTFYSSVSQRFLGDVLNQPLLIDVMSMNRQ